MIRLRVASLAVFPAVLLVSCASGTPPQAGDFPAKAPQPSTAAASRAVTAAVLTPSPSPSLSPVTAWIALSGLKLPTAKSGELPLPPIVSTPRVPAPTIYRALFDLPLSYDETVKLVRQRDPQARLAAITLQSNAGGKGDVTLATVAYYSPLDDVLVSYRYEYSVFKYGPSLQSGGVVTDWNDHVANEARLTNQRPPPDFKDAAPLKEPWASSYVQAASLRTWELAAQPSEFGVSLVMSARVPWDTFVWMDNGKYGNDGSTLAVLISRGSDYYARAGEP